MSQSHVYAKMSEERRRNFSSGFKVVLALVCVCEWGAISPSTIHSSKKRRMAAWKFMQSVLGKVNFLLPQFSAHSADIKSMCEHVRKKMMAERGERDGNVLFNLL
jgi:hypothetical protein